MKAFKGIWVLFVVLLPIYGCSELGFGNKVATPIVASALPGGATAALQVVPLMHDKILTGQNLSLNLQLQKCQSAVVTWAPSGAKPTQAIFNGRGGPQAFPWDNGGPATISVQCSGLEDADSWTWIASFSLASDRISFRGMEQWLEQGGEKKCGGAGKDWKICPVPTVSEPVRQAAPVIKHRQRQSTRSGRSGGRK